MNNKDLLGLEIKSLLNEDTRNLELSPLVINNIMSKRNKTWREKFNEFLDKEIEIPLSPVILGFAALLVITILPKDIIKSQEIKVINIGSSQIFIRNEKDVSRYENKN